MKKTKTVFCLLLLVAMCTMTYIGNTKDNESTELSQINHISSNHSQTETTNQVVSQFDTQKHDEIRIEKIGKTKEQTCDIDLNFIENVDYDGLQHQINTYCYFEKYKTIINGQTVRHANERSGNYFRFFSYVAAPCNDMGAFITKQFPNTSTLDSDLIGYGVQNTISTFYLQGINTQNEIVYRWGTNGKCQYDAEYLFVTLNFEMYKIYNPSTYEIRFYRKSTLLPELKSYM